MSSVPAVCTRVLVSWDGSGAMTGPYDDVTRDTAGDPGVAVEHGRDGAQSLAPPKVSAGSFELYNHDGTYSQQRADSPVYQRVLPGRPVGYRVTYGESALYRADDAYRVDRAYRGQVDASAGLQIIDEISQTTGWGEQRVQIRTLGQEVVLTQAIVSVPLQTAIRTDQAITLLLDEVGWPDDRRAISSGDTTLAYWWCDGRHPWDAMLELLGAEGPGALYVTRDGTLHFEGRNYRTITERSTTSQAIYLDHTEGSGGLAGGDRLYRDDGLYRSRELYRGQRSPLWFTALTYDPGYQNIYNRATYSTTRRSVAASAAVWQYGTTITLAAGEQRTLFARPSDPFTNAVVPAETTDYVVTPPGGVTVTMDATNGFVAFISLTAGPSGATILGPGSAATGLQLRAQALVPIASVAVNDVDASTSIETFSPVPGAAIPITLTVAGWPEVDEATATAVCNAWVTRYKDARPLVTIVVHGVDEAHLAEIMSRIPSDRITLVEANTGLDSDVWINATELRVFGAGGRVVQAIFACELCDTVGGAVWDTAFWDHPAAVWGI